ncbi:PREDICTED: RING-H2 finger protein ATL5-like [Lupinus angustifolius]|uniref:RING-H2 finger protein ATL5-like n=1 Tax=Lupinus angustifolius TaxID=3871 RepID=UPI00092E3069|nr:PREDICTED: RING-H2 finger protein ATL5-like [Lupinus angustifolius]
MVSENNEDDHPRGNFHGTSATVTLATTLSLVAVILVIALVYFYARHHLRLDQRRRQQSFLRRINNQIANADVNSSRSPNSGLDPIVIASLPRLLYKETNQFIQGDVVECSVCLGTIVEDETIRVLPNCKHVFHIDCVDKWFASNSTCPVCRAVVEPTVQPELDNSATTEVQPTAPPVEDVSHVDVSHETEKVSCSGLRIASFPRMVIGMERSLRRSYDGSAAVEDIENQ